jgi:uncharacterized protein YdeI (YjbR/CyaY-like superfamily)
MGEALKFFTSKFYNFVENLSASKEENAMPPVPIGETFYAATRAEWRQWLAENHDKKGEIWLVSYSDNSEKPRIPYLHTVEEALCFGWIDGIQKRMDVERTVQRFTPRKPKSHWTELNKERARRLIASGQMTEAGLAVLPDLSAPFQIPADILEALQRDPQVWENFQQFPDVYQRIRISFIDEVRRQPEVFQTRLANFLKKTRENKMFGVME